MIAMLIVVFSVIIMRDNIVTLPVLIAIVDDGMYVAGMCIILMMTSS